MLPRKILDYVLPYRWKFASALGQIFVIGAFDLLKPWPLQIIIDDALSGHKSPLPFGLADLPPLHLAAVAAAALVLIHVVSGALNVQYNWLAIGLGQNMVNDLRGQLYAHLQRLSLAYHGKQKLGDLMMRITGDSFAVQTMIMNGLLPILSALVLLIGMVIVLWPIDPLLTVVAMLIVPALFGLVALFNRKIADVATIVRDNDSLVYSLVQWGMGGIKYIQAFTKEAAEHRRFMDASGAALDAHRRLYAWQTGYSAVINGTIAASTALVILVGAREVLHGSLSVGQLLVFTGYLAQLYAPVNQITQSWSLIAGARVGAARCFDVLETEPELKNGTAFFPPDGARGLIEWRDTSFKYRPDAPILRHINVTAEPGKMIALVGATGAGKSTLLGLLARFFDPVDGTVLVDGLDVRQYDLQSLRQQISMVLQPPLVFPLSVRDNIAYGRPEATLDEVREAARIASIDRTIEALPEGYDTLVGESGATLSEGEKQRLTIARALLHNAPILILDEPTSALDTETEALVMAAVDRLRRDRTTFIIAHRLSTVRRADEILVLKDGEICEKGSFTALIERGGLFAHLYTTQFAVDEGS